RGRIKGSRQTPRKWTAPNPISTWAMTKKGRSDGRTTSNQRRRPSREASKALRGKRTTMAVKSTAPAAVAYATRREGRVWDGEVTGRARLLSVRSWAVAASPFLCAPGGRQTGAGCSGVSLDGVEGNPV